MTKGVRKAITQYVQRRYEGNLDNYLFTGQKSKDKPITRVTAWRNIKAAADILGLKTLGHTHYGKLLVIINIRMERILRC